MSFQGYTEDHYQELSEKIFDVQWLIRTKRQSTYTQDDFEVFGIPASGDPVLDGLDMNEWVTTTRPISELVEMYEHGKEFYFVNPADMEGVFNIIVDYTNYIAWYINNSINLTYYKAEENPKLQQLLTDVVKLQNLGNRIFPIMTARDDMTYESKGLLGYLNKRRNLQGIRRLDFDPITRYGVTEDDFRNPELFDTNEKSFRIIDMKKSFNPRTAQFMENI